ncbi:MAG: YkgJ family cysteine cluster protein [Nitrospirota bacterium]|nr:YkgJ family cysteine cluster protein [Nitrospirota bacterium]
MKRKTIRIAGSDSVAMEMNDPVGLTCGVAGCDANCCKNGPHIILNPYEIALICSASGLSYEDLLDVVETDRVNGFPLVMLPRDPACHFWTEQGCSIYAARPLACRLFPLGRVFDHGRSFFVTPDRNLCKGLAQAPSRTLAQYLDEQDTKTQITMADRWIEFVTEMEQQSFPDKPVTSVAFHMLVYSPDTPPSSDSAQSPESPEDRFLLRMDTARRKLPQFLRSS